MASKSRAAQEALMGLESDFAPFEDQVAEAAKFISADLDSIGRSANIQYRADGKLRSVTHHGREEWLLKWLLKKLQAPKDDISRKSALSWRVICHLICVLPLAITARIFIERKFMLILRHTLEDIKASQNLASPINSREETEANRMAQQLLKSRPKKRNRSGEFISSPVKNTTHALRDLLTSMLVAMEIMVQSAYSTPNELEEDRSAAFSTEYMKMALRSTPEELAKIFGTWLSLLSIPGVYIPDDELPWLSPLINIWQNRLDDKNSLQHFSMSCLPPLLSLFDHNNASLNVQLEKLLAQNIIVPAKAAYMENEDLILFKDFTRLAVILDSDNATRLFEVAVRSTQPLNFNRRKIHDELWLRNVFAALKESMPTQGGKTNIRALSTMIRSALLYKVTLELPILRLIAAEFAFSDMALSLHEWNLLSALLKLDANVFLIPEMNTNLLANLLTRITHASIQPSWPEIAEEVVVEVLVPLMNEFAKARDLLGFIHHWHAQLVEFERLRKETTSLSVQALSAWEHELLYKSFSKVMEAALTPQKIIQILDWLSTQVVDNPGAVCIILEAITGSVSQEEVVDAIGLRCCHIMFDDGASETLDERYRWRSWNILSQSLKWITNVQIDEVAKSWEEREIPFASFYAETDADGLLGDFEVATATVETLGMLRFACASWSVAREGNSMEIVARPVLLDLLRKLDHDVQHLLEDLQGGIELGNKLCRPNLNVLSRSTGWMIWSFFRCLFMEFPNVLSLASELDTFEDTLKSIFWIASAGQGSFTFNSKGSNLNNTDFSDLWTSALNSDAILNSPNVIATMIDIMIDDPVNAKNPLLSPHLDDEFLIQSLLILPPNVLHRNHREKILRSWQPAIEDSKTQTSGALNSFAVSPAVLALKIKTMQRPLFYTDMKFVDLEKLADALADAQPTSQTSLALYKELVRLTIEFVFTNWDSTRNRVYVSEMILRIQKRVKKAHEKSNCKWNYAFISLFGTAISFVNARASSVEKHEIASLADLRSISDFFRDSIHTQLQNTLEKHRKQRFIESSTSYLVILSIIDAISSLGPDARKLSELKKCSKSFIDSESQADFELGSRLKFLFMASGVAFSCKDHQVGLIEDTHIIHSRKSIVDMAFTITTGERAGKHSALKAILSQQGVIRLDKLITARQIVISIDDERKLHDENVNEAIIEGRGEYSFDLSMAYSLLCKQLRNVSSVRAFCLISETLELLLRTKPHSISQWNIDITLSSLTILTSRSGPMLRPSRASVIYLHLCSILRTILLSHRLKISGHFHILVQALQALLRCLSTPFPHSSRKTLAFYSPPPWLPPSQAKISLGSKHAAAFTRLVTLICDPSVSSVTRPRHNSLTSATEKAKREASQHMQLVLLMYIKLQLEMRMLPEVREKLTPGLYAILDTTTTESRRAISEGLDASGRAVFGTLYRDYLKFGKWKGS